MSSENINLATLRVAPSTNGKEFALAALPYAVDALEPYVDKATMEIHHDRHHGAYVSNLNAQFKNFPALANIALEELQGQVSKFNDAVRNNGGGHYNHSLFWKVMAAQGQGGEASGALLEAVNATFGSLDELKKRFGEAALTRFGSGWAWLLVTAEKKLAVTSTPNQDNPLMDLPGIVRGTPLLGLDVWEHAYYLKYQNKRGDYVANWWNVVNWKEVSNRFAAAVSL